MIWPKVEVRPHAAETKAAGNLVGKARRMMNEETVGLGLRAVKQPCCGGELRPRTGCQPIVGSPAITLTDQLLGRDQTRDSCAHQRLADPEPRADLHQRAHPQHAAARHDDIAVDRNDHRGRANG